MAQEFTINSKAIEDKVNQLLPSQGGFGAGVDFSASTMVVPIIDLTESAEGSSLRADLQTSLSLDSVTSFIANSNTVTVVNNTGYWRIFGGISVMNNNTANRSAQFQLTDGITTKIILNYSSLVANTTPNVTHTPFDFNILLQAGQSLTCTAGASINVFGCSRQLASLDGTLTNP